MSCCFLSLFSNFYDKRSQTLQQFIIQNYNVICLKVSAVLGNDFRHGWFSSSIKHFNARRDVLSPRSARDPENEREQNTRIRLSPSRQCNRIDERIRRHNLSVIFPLVPLLDVDGRERFLSYPPGGTVREQAWTQVAIHGAHEGLRPNTRKYALYVSLATLCCDSPCRWVRT